ncbi:hypothetical protein OS493_008368 [Desmophyllum pertusum]|uniref:Transmembrane protein n=1 Tax=Desmophyllum pertusum TaxID=174260 RepID=A0A9X0A4S2_9CNID|nr:hypothetical protein OS493_008368 [Desmophyllum pertusum]
MYKQMKTVIIYAFLVVAFISMSSFALPSYASCKQGCDNDQDLCESQCSTGAFSCSICDSAWDACTGKC